MYKRIDNLGIAPTLEDLASLVKEAISRAGQGAKWMAHEDGEIRIYPEDGEAAIVIIEQPRLYI